MSRVTADLSKVGVTDKLRLGATSNRGTSKETMANVEKTAQGLSRRKPKGSGNWCEVG